MLKRIDRDLTMSEAARTPGGARVDLVVVASMVEPGAKVLDVGCGDGELLRLLAETRGVDGRGIELSREGVNECVAKGLAAVQGDADTDLADYPDDAFDYVILSQTLQATRQPRVVLEHMFPRLEVLRLDCLLRGLDAAGDHAGLNGHALFHAEALEQGGDPLARKDAHEVVLEREVEARGSGVALAAGASAKLVVDAA